MKKLSLIFIIIFCRCTGILVVILLGIPSLFAQTQPPNPLKYQIERRDSSSLLIQVSFAGNKSGKTIFHLPNNWASEKQLYKAVTQLRALSKLTTVDSSSNPDEYIIRYAPDSKIVLTYILSQGWSGPLIYPKFFRPIIQKDVFYFEGYSGLAFPDVSDPASIICEISYKGFPKDAFFGNSFFANKKRGEFTTSLNDLRNSFFCAGDFRAKTVNVRDHKIVMAIYGKFSYTDDEAFSSISKIIINEREFWNDAGPLYYFTLVMPTDDKSNNGGTGHYNSFSLFQSNDVELANGILQTISHEYFHSWIGTGLKNPSPDETYKWFSEGFTDYYSLKLLNKAGILSNEDFIKKLNQDIRGYYLSPYFKSGSQEIVGKYWSSSDWTFLPYRRGTTIAFMLDSKIQEKQQSSSLDNLMKLLYNKSKPGMIFSDTLFNHLVVQFAGDTVLSAVTAANNGINDALTKELTGNKIYQTEIKAIPKSYDVGFDINESKKAKKIIGVKTGSNAEKAGLRENMVISGSFFHWDNNHEGQAKVGVTIDGKKQWISYITDVISTVNVPQILGGK